jgi:putative addiction module component (TIGR02574 family)
MSMTELLNEVSKLPVDLRIKFVQSVLDTIADDQTDREFTPEEQCEIEARIRAVDADPSICVSWDEAKARARAARP